jgi:PII-like signaling protein
MRIFFGESDRWQGKPLYEALLQLLRERGIAGATVLRAVAGYGPSSTIHTANLLRFSSDLPMVLEVVDATDKIEAVVPELDQRMGGGLITLEKVEVILHRADQG